MKTRSKVLLSVFTLALLLGIALVGTGVWYLRSERFQEYVRKQAMSRLESATGLSCRIERLAINPFRGSFRISGFALDSPSGLAAPVHIKADEISGSLKLRSIVTLRLNLVKMDVARPRVALNGGAGESQWNPEEFLRAYRTSLDLEAGEVSLRDGELSLNNQRVPFDFLLNNLLCEIRFLQKPPSYRVHIAYQNGKFKWAQRNLEYDLDARATVGMTGIDFDSVAIRYSRSRLNGQGWMRDWKSPVILFHASGVVAADNLEVFEGHLRGAGGEIQVQTNLRWDESGFRSTARFSSASGNYRKVAVTSLRGVMAIEGGVLKLGDVEGRIGAGSFQAGATFHLRSADSKPHYFETTVKDVSLRDAAEIIEIPDIAYENTVDGRARLSWRHGNRDLELDSEIQIHEAPAVAGAGAMRTNLAGSVAFHFSKGTWSLSSADLHSPFTELEAVGDGRTGFHVQLRSARVADILSVLRNFSPSLRETLARYPDLMDISGSYELAGDVLIDPSAAVSYKGSLHVTNGRWRSYSLDSLTATALWDGAELDLQSLAAQKGGGNASGNFHLVLAQEETRPPAISFQGDIRQVPLSSLEEIGLDIGKDVSGVLSGNGSISGREGAWRGEGQAVIEKGSYKGETFDVFQAHARLADGTLFITGGQLTRQPAKLGIQGQIQLESRQMDLELRLVDFSLRSLPAVQENKLEVDGTISATGRIRGEFDNPSLSGSLDFQSLRYANWDLGRGKGTLEIKDRMLTGDASVRSDLGGFKVRADISTQSGCRGTVLLDLREWDARKLITTSLPPYLNDLSTALQGRVTIKGSFADPATLTYDGEMDGARFKFRDYELSNSGKVRFISEAAAGKRKLQVLGATIVGEGTRLTLKGDLPLDENATLDLKLDGNLNLKMLDQLEKRVQLAGSADLSVRAIGTARNPQIIGQAEVRNSRLEYGDLPFHFSGVQGNIVFSRNLVRLENIHGGMASGTFQLSGALEQQNAQLRGINLQFSARRTRLPYPKDFRSTADADLTLRGSPEAQVLAGEVRIIRSEYLREFSLLDQLASRSPSASGPLTSDPFLVGLRLNIGIVSEESLYVDNELTKLRGGMRLTLRGTPAYPSLTGRIEANEGSIFFRGNRFDIVRASADFVDRNRINPVLDVRAEADVKSYRLVLDVNGDLDHMRFNVSSDPPLSTVDIVTLLTTGKEAQPGDINSRRQAEITGLSAASILSESLTGVIGKRVQRIFGLQTFRVDPFLAGAENDPTARVTISERVAKDLNITFSRNLSTNEEQIIIVEYEVNKNLSIVATRNENGEFGLDFRFRKRFR